MISSLCLAEVQHPHQLRSSAPRKTFRPRKCPESIKRTDDERLPRFLDCRKWKTTARPQIALRQPETTTGPGPPASETDARPLATEAESAQAYLAQNLPERIRAGNSRETHRTEKKAFRARADSAQSARQGGTEPGTTRFRDGRATTRPPAPRRGLGAPAAQPRPRGPDLESAQI